MLQGWLFGVDQRIPEFHIVEPGTGQRVAVTCNGESEDVVSAHGPAARNCRFSQRYQVGFTAESLSHLELHVVTAQGVDVWKDALTGALGNEAVHHTFGLFMEAIESMAPGCVVEIGARARSGITRRHLIPSQHKYLGVDIRDGENVDLVLDAHQLSSKIEAASVDALFCFSVFEHLAMPWKVALEINKVLKVGGVGFIMTHQSWPVHDAPWDYWRFADQSWKALFNRQTGFALLDAKMSDPAYIVPRIATPERLFDEQAGGFLQSAAFFQKTSETTLSWDVSLDDLESGEYPA
ncbi:MAG: class I SAM-dependent methyltransferase [Gammaproteobacteria bacterium]|nr:class I SAM-dependent methyltransferase [Gammaproteobacteria bacterium]